MLKRKIAFLAAVALVVGMLSACGNNTAEDNAGNGAENTADDNVGSDTENTAGNSVDNASGNGSKYVYLSEIDVDEYVTLGEYKGIELTEALPVVSEEDVNQYINTYVLPSYATTTAVDDRTDVREGDTVNIDYVGYRDGVAFDGGTAQGYDLTIGSGTFIPGFEDGLIGSNVGETVSLNLTFPEDYRSTEMAGASVTFEVTINSISVLEIPELTDEFARESNIGDCSTVEELNTYFYNYLYSSVESTYNRTVRNDLANAVMANCVFEEELPGKLIDRYYDILIDDMTATASLYGMDLNTYVQNNYNMDEETYTGIIRNNAQTMAQQYIMFQAIANVEGIEMTEEERNAALEEWVQTYGYGSVDNLLEQMDEKTLNEYLMAEKVAEFLIENAVINTNEAE